MSGNYSYLQKKIKKNEKKNKKKKKKKRLASTIMKEHNNLNQETYTNFVTQTVPVPL